MGVHRPVIHGSDHRKGGPDPIPGGDTWPTNHLMFPWTSVDVIDNGDYDRVTDLGSSGSVFGAYGEATSNGDTFMFPVRLGPIGSLWELTLIAHSGTDFGIVQYEFGSAQENEYGEGRYTLSADTTFYALGTGRDFNSAASKNDDYHEQGFRIKGADGDPLTAAINTNDPDVPAFKQFNGGAGLYLFRVRTSGTTSGSYKVQIVSIELRRSPG